MDELQISGRRFISSRRAAKDNGYTTDYIGQLIRAGKVKGQKVGRAWYVDSATLDAYLGTEGGQGIEPAVEQVQPAAARERITVVNFSQAQVPQADVQAQQEGLAKEETSSVRKPVDVPMPETTLETSSDVTEVREKEEVQAPATIAINRFQDRPIAVRGLQYVEEESLLPEIEPKASDSRLASPMSKQFASPADQEFDTSGPGEHAIERPRKGIGSMLVVGAAVFVFCALVSSTLFQTISIEAGASASVGYSMHL